MGLGFTEVGIAEALDACMLSEFSTATEDKLVSALSCLMETDVLPVVKEHGLI
jgi:hypothetical protein